MDFFFPLTIDDDHVIFQSCAGVNEIVGKQNGYTYQIPSENFDDFTLGKDY